MWGEVIKDHVVKSSECMLKIMAKGVPGPRPHFRKISLITVENGLKATKPKQEKLVRRLMGKCFSR